MDDETKKIIAWIVQVLIIMGIIIGVYFGFKNSSLGKTLGSLAGALAGIATAFDKMIDSCNKHGWASPKYCPAGFTGILLGSVFVAGNLIKLYGNATKPFRKASGSTAETAEKLGAVNEQDPIDIQTKYIRQINVDEYNKLRDKKIADFQKADPPPSYEEAQAKAQKFMEVSSDLQVQKKMYEERAKALDAKDASPEELAQNERLQKATLSGIRQNAMNAEENPLSQDEVSEAEDADFMDVGE